MLKKMSYTAVMLFTVLFMGNAQAITTPLTGHTFSGPESWTGMSQGVSAGETFDSSWDIVLDDTFNMTFIFTTTASSFGGVGDTNISISGTGFSDTLTAPSDSKSFSTTLSAGTYTMFMSSATGGLPILGGSYNVGAVASVPLPAAAWLMGSALVGLVSFGRRKTGLAA